MGMFLTEVIGPRAAEEFAEIFAVELKPLIDEIASASAWQDNDGRMYLAGYADEDPTDTVARVVARRDWVARTRYLTAFSNLPLPRRTRLVCDMPNNRHFIHHSKLSCAQGHDVSDDHNVSMCPLCGLQLR